MCASTLEQNKTLCDSPEGAQSVSETSPVPEGHSVRKKPPLQKQHQKVRKQEQRPCGKFKFVWFGHNDHCYSYGNRGKLASLRTPSQP